MRGLYNYSIIIYKIDQDWSALRLRLMKVNICSANTSVTKCRLFMQPGCSFSKLRRLYQLGLTMSHRMPFLCSGLELGILWPRSAEADGVSAWHRSVAAEGQQDRNLSCSSLDVPAGQADKGSGNIRCSDMVDYAPYAHEMSFVWGMNVCCMNLCGISVAFLQSKQLRSATFVIWSTRRKSDSCQSLQVDQPKASATRSRGAPLPDYLILTSKIDPKDSKIWNQSLSMAGSSQDSRQYDWSTGRFFFHFLVAISSTHNDVPICHFFRTNGG